MVRLGTRRHSYLFSGGTVWRLTAAVEVSLLRRRMENRHMPFTGLAPMIKFK